MTFAYFSILILFFLNLFCAAYAKTAGGFKVADNRNPRDFLAKTTGKAARANAAQQNGHEIIALYAAAVLIAHATGEANTSIINFWAFVFILARVAYIWAYIQNQALLRSLFWSLSLLSIVALFIAAI